MINPLYSITTFDGIDFSDYLKKIHLYDIFIDIFDEYPEPETRVGIIKFIAWGYGLDSDLLSTNGNNWSKVSEQIFLKTGLETELFPDVGLLESKSVQSAVQKFLRYQNDENWTQYCTYRDLRSQMLSSSLAAIKKSSGEIDYEQKMNNAAHSQKLLEMMNEAKETFVQNHPKLKASVEAFNKATEKTKVTRSVASYAS